MLTERLRRALPPGSARRRRYSVGVLFIAGPGLAAPLLGETRRAPGRQRRSIVILICIYLRHGIVVLIDYHRGWGWRAHDDDLRGWRWRSRLIGAGASEKLVEHRESSESQRRIRRAAGDGRPGSEDHSDKSESDDRFHI
jgi:hypothetical protein